MRKLTLFTILALFTTALLAHHHDAKPDAKGDPMLRQLDSLAGSWRCTGTVFASPMGPERASTGDLELRWGLDGHWLPFSYTEKKSAAAPMPFSVTGFIGFDAEQQKLVLGSVDNMGGYATATSDGWHADSLVFEGPWHMGTMTAASRDTFTRKSDRELVHLGEIELNGAWMKLSRETCTRK